MNKTLDENNKKVDNLIEFKKDVNKNRNKGYISNEPSINNNKDINDNEYIISKLKDENTKLNN